MAKVVDFSVDRDGNDGGDLVLGLVGDATGNLSVVEVDALMGEMVK